MTSLVMRKPHHKSRLGCTTCKKRRVKCDGARPYCQNCSKRKLDCSFRAQVPAARFSPFLSTTLDERGLSRVLVFSPTSEETLARPSQSPSPPLLLDTLEQHGLLSFSDNSRPHLNQILHHFFTVTCVDLTFDNGARMTWPTAVTQLAASHPFILEGIFAVGSLHLSRCAQSDNERRSNFNLAMNRLNKGLETYRNEIQHVTIENAEALFAFSMMTTVCTLTTFGDECRALIDLVKDPKLELSRRQSMISDMILTTTTTLRCIRGVLLIIVPCWDHISKGVLSPVVSREWPIRPIPATPEAVEEDRKLHKLETMWMQPGRKYEFYFNTLANTLKQLRECFALVSELSVSSKIGQSGKAATAELDWSSVATWPVHAPYEFTSLLELRVPEAWVILAHYAIVQARVQGPWWWEHMPSNLVMTAACILRKEQWKLIEWPARIVGVDLASLRLERSGSE